MAIAFGHDGRACCLELVPPHAVLSVVSEQSLFSINLIFTFLAPVLYILVNYCDTVLSFFLSCTCIYDD